MIANLTVAPALKAGGVATGAILLLGGVLYTPVGVLVYLLVDGLIAGPLDALGWVDMEQERNAVAFFRTAFGLIAVAAWLFFFMLSFRLFKASAERRARIREEQEYE